jgi:hypothetical protein
LRTALLLALLALAALVPALGGASPAAAAPGDAAIARAEALSAEWGRCPTSRPAHRVLAQARRTSAAAPRVKRARAAVRSWTRVARVCAQPVPQPTVSPPAAP